MRKLVCEMICGRYSTNVGVYASSIISISNTSKFSCFEITKSYIAPLQTVEESPPVEEHTKYLEWILEDT
jgi:hypothetical protein